jgi:hypothetical protein
MLLLLIEFFRVFAQKYYDEQWKKYQKFPERSV